MKTGQTLKNLSLALAAAVLLAASGSAQSVAAPAAAAAPAGGSGALVGMIKGDGLLRREFSASLSALSSPAALLNPALPAQTLGVLPPTTDKVYAHTNSQLLRMLVAYPELIPAAKDRKELNTLIKNSNARPDTLDAGLKAISQLHAQAAAEPNGELAQKLAALKAEFAAAAGSTDGEAMRAQVERFMDNAREGFIAQRRAELQAVAAPAGSGAAAAGPQLVKSDGPAAPRERREIPAPGADAASLQAHVREHLKLPGREKIYFDDVMREKHGVSGLKWAYFEPGEYSPAFESALKAEGVDVVVVRRPTPDELSSMREEQGYFRRSEWNRWVAQTVKPQEYLARHKGSVNSLYKSRELIVENRPIDSANWKEWYEEIYAPFVRSINGQLFAPDSAEKLADLSRWWGVFLRDPSSRRLLGAIADKQWEDPNLLWGHYAAFRDELKQKGMNPDERSTFEEINLARWLGMNVYSAGLDHNFKGGPMGRGLFAHKVSMGFELYPEREIQILKVLDPSKFLLPKNGEGKNEGIVFLTLTPEMERRYVESWKAGAEAAAGALLGGPFFSPAIMAPPLATVMRHFYTDDVRVPVPGEISLVRKPLEELP